MIFNIQNAPNRFVIILVGTVSSHEDREVDHDVITTFAKEQNISYFECHTDTGKGIDDVFSELVDKVMENFHSATREISGWFI